MSKKEIFFSLDIETNGQAPGLHSMLSLGCAAFDPETGDTLGTYFVNLLPLEGAGEDAETMEWWKKFPEKYQEATRNAVPAADAIQEFVGWVQEVAAGRKAVAACKPTWDFHFIHWYLVKFLGRAANQVFGHRAYCIKTAVAEALGLPFRGYGDGDVPAAWRGGLPHTHNALEDALEAAEICKAARAKLVEMRKMAQRTTEEANGKD